MYTVKVLSEKEFDKLPYKHTKTSLGLADAKTGVAYVRDTGYNDITKDTIAHELDELMAKVSPHEEDGIRYKNLKSLGAGAGAGVLSSMIPMLRPFQGAISAGAGALAGKKGNRLQGALQGFSGGGIGTGLGGGVFDAFKAGTGPQGTFGKALKSFVPGVSRALVGGGSNDLPGQRSYFGTVPGFEGVGTGDPKGALAKFFSSGGGAATRGTAAGTAGQAYATGGKGTGQPLVGMPTQGITGGAGSAAQFAQQQAGSDSTLKPGGGFFDKLFGGGGDDDNMMKKLALGLGVAGAGDLLAPKVEAPDTSGIQARLQGRLEGGAESGAKKAGLNELFRILGEDIGAPPQSAFAQGDLYADRQLTDDITALRNEFKAVNPNANVDNNSAFLDKKQELIERSREQRTAARDELSYAHEQEQLGRKFQTMQVALNLDQAQMSQYVQLAQMEVDQLMLQYGIDAQTATNFKEMFSDLGRIATGTQSSGIDNYFNSLAQKNQEVA